MDDYSRFVPAVKFELIPIKNLVSNQEYQRALSQKHINRAAANFDVFQINPVKVSRRDGINYVFNGQHTIEIVALVSGSRETPVWCMVYEDLYYEHEADIFANQQKFVKQLSSYEIFVASIEAGNDKEVIIKDLVESYGMRIGKTRAPGVICSIATLESIYTKYGVAVLDRTLRMVIGTWEGDVNSFGANILSAIAKLIVVYDENNNKVFAFLLCLPYCFACTYAKRFGFIVLCQDDTMAFFHVPADCYRVLLQFGSVHAFNRGVEIIHIYMEDGSFHRPLHSPPNSASLSLNLYLNFGSEYIIH